MTENRTDDQIQTSPNRRFTVDGFKRVPRAYIPTLAIGAAVVIVATVIFMIDILAK